jgi:2-polyprenyl-3-methyl-5-hydroxy-6-metoxy-1,4-benzoquinol methylase
MANNYICRVCGSNKTENLGALPKQTHFAGVQLGQSLPESNLYECKSCLMLARHPVLSVSDYNQLYEQLASTIWPSNNFDLRQDQRIVRNIILNKFKTDCKVLDVGCYTGDLLVSLPAEYIKFGIEMSMKASMEAVSRGVNIIGNDLYNIRTNDKFDLIVAMDVIEHTHNPEDFLKKLSTMLEVGGEIIISTGNSDNWLWKYLKNRFWYSKFPEHISFIGEKWLENFCDKNNFIITDQRIFSYHQVTSQFSFKNAVKLALFLMKIGPEKFSRVTKDHFCFVIKK